MDFDFLSSNLQIAYPFRDIITVTRPSGDAEINGLVAAIRVYTYDQRSADLYLDEIDLRSSDSFATLDTAKLELRWSDGTQLELIDGSNAVARVVTYGSWIVVRWRHTSEDFVFHIVFPAAVVEGGTLRFWKADNNIRILAALVKQGPGKVRRVYVKRGTTLTQVAGPGEELSVQPGFNMQLEAGATSTDDGARKLTRVAVDAVPGAGLGRYLICQSAAFLRTLSGVGPDDNGNLKLGPEECYWLEIPLASGPTPVPEPQHNITKVATLEPNQVQLRNACGACCSCEDYIKTYENLRRHWDDARAVAAQIDALRNSYVAVSAALVAKQPSDNVLVIRQRDEDLLLVQISAWNNSGAPITDDIEITTDVTLPDGVTFEVSQSLLFGPYGAESVTPTQTDSELSTTIGDGLESLQVYYWILLLRLTGIANDDEVEVSATITGGMEKSGAKTLTWEAEE